MNTLNSYYVQYKATLSKATFLTRFRELLTQIRSCLRTKDVSYRRLKGENWFPAINYSVGNMSGGTDQGFYNYGHGIVSQNCFAKEYSGSEFIVKLVFSGTFVQVHSIRDDDVLFCIVRDDMQVEMNQMVCKKADIISVPENLWGPLFTVKKVARLSLVKDSKVAESIGNISVGHTVQVLGPDNTVICIANVTFRNSIGRLGVGIYFGLQVMSSKESLQAIIKKVSLLGPGTKGFPRGCDIVVTVDKIRPDNCNIERSVRNHDGEHQGCLVKSFPTGEREESSGNFKSKIFYSTKEKHSNSYNKDYRASSPDSEFNMNHCFFEKRINSDNPLSVGDEVIYLDGGDPEKGLVRWIGFIENTLKVGVEFDHPVGSSKGLVDDIDELFGAKKQHPMIVSPMALIKLSDYRVNASKNTIYSKKNNINNNINCNFVNNINNNSNSNSSQKIYSSITNTINNNKVSCRVNTNSEEICVRSRRVSVPHQCLGHPEKFNFTDRLHEANTNEVIERKEAFVSGHRSEETFESEGQNISKSFDFSGFGERKSVGYRRHSSSTDSSLVHKESNLYANGQEGKNYARWNISSDDLSDLPRANLVESHHSYCCADENLQQFSDREGEGLPFLKSTAAQPRTFSGKVLEQSLFAKKTSPGFGSNSDELYDVPPCTIRRAFSGNDNEFPFSFQDSYNHEFYVSSRHTLAPTVLNYKWDSQYSEYSSSDENLTNLLYCEPSNPSHSSNTALEDLGRGSVVELTFKGESLYGVIRWIGTFPDEKDSSPRLIAGIEMEEEYPGFTDGTFRNKRYFLCNPRKALFVPLSKCKKDSRFSEESQKQTFSSKINYGQKDCPVVEGTIPPINRKGDIESICGKNRGIQGHHNSCYLDATLFSMFAFTSVFDSILYRPQTKSDIPQYSEVQRVLREEIVNPLRKNLYVRADRVMKLRTLLEKLSSVSGLTSEEKDPEEFLNSLLAQILRAEPFLKLSSGQETFHYQLFVEKDERLILPSVQQLFEQSFVTSDIKLKQVPSCLIIQMPRFGKSFKMYSRILPPHLLDITDIIENSPRQCTVCGKLAEFECKDCFGQQGIGNALESISFCKTCLDTAHNHHWRNKHNARSLTVPVEFYELQEHCVIPRLYMELFAVVCIETSHYVAFVKCGSGSDAPWCFFDSMADRKGEQNGYNIPEMVPCPDLPYWLSEEGAKMLNEMRDERQLPEHAKRLFSDAYMCMYQSPDLMMYR